MSVSIKGDADFASIQADLAALKTDVSNLIGHLKTGVAAGAQDAVVRLESGTRGLYRGAAKESDRAVAAIGQQVERKPLVALLLLLGVGFIGGRLFSR